MFKFFRKIRLNLMEQNKTGRYLKYAIGEIVLVVVGILIALQLNNLNDERKTEAVRQVYYKQLLNDFEKDKKYIERQSLNYDSNEVKLNTYFEAFKQSDMPMVQILGELSNLSWTFRDVQFQSNTILTLQNTGDIKLIPTPIRDKIVSLKEYKEHTVYVSRGNNQIGLEMVNAASKVFGSVSLFLERSKNQPKLLDYLSDENRQIQMIFALESAQERKSGSETQSLERFEQILLDIEELTVLINSELEK
jgi:hypothetical protein